MSDSPEKETKVLTPEQAKRLLDRTLAKIHQSGMSAVAVINISTPGGDETVTRMFTHGDMAESARDVLHLTDAIRKQANRTLMEYYAKSDQSSGQPQSGSGLLCESQGFPVGY